MKMMHIFMVNHKGSLLNGEQFRIFFWQVFWQKHRASPGCTYH